MDTQIIATEECPLFYLAARVRTTEAVNRVFILGNAYGVMPYQSQVARMLSEKGYESIWFPFSGQPGSTGGHFSIRAGVEDLARVIGQAQAHLGPAKGSTSILAHCASGLIAIEYLRRHPQSDITKLIAYSPLAKPRRLKVRAERRLAEIGVKSGLSDWDWDYWAGGAISQVRGVSVLLFHVGDAFNRPRATLAELQQIARALPGTQVASRPQGYDQQRESVPEFCRHYDRWLQGYE